MIKFIPKLLTCLNKDNRINPIRHVCLLLNGEQIVLMTYVIWRGYK